MTPRVSAATGGPSTPATPPPSDAQISAAADPPKMTPGPQIHMPEVGRNALGAWLGGSLLWGLMTGAVTRQVKPAAVSAGVVAASAVGRLLVRGTYPVRGDDTLVTASGTARGALVGAAVGACIATGNPEGTLRGMMRLTGRGTALGTAIGAAAGLAEAKTDTFFM